MLPKWGNLNERALYTHITNLIVLNVINATCFLYCHNQYEHYTALRKQNSWLIWFEFDHHFLQLAPLVIGNRCLYLDIQMVFDGPKQSSFTGGVEMFSRRKTRIFLLKNIEYHEWGPLKVLDWIKQDNLRKWLHFSCGTLHSFPLRVCSSGSRPLVACSHPTGLLLGRLKYVIELTIYRI